MDQELQPILDAYLDLVESPENQRRKNLWQPEPMTSRDKFRRIPKPASEVGVPVVADTAASLWRDVFGFNMREYYTQPQVYLLNYLKAAIAHFQLGDDTHLGPTIGHFPSVGLESSVFGMTTVYDDAEEPTVGRDYPLKQRSDLEALTVPDFHRSGMMPLLHRFYEEINDTLQGTGLRMDFANYIRAPYGVAFQIREFTNLAIDSIDDPGWIHRLMRFLTDCHVKWYRDRSSFLNRPVPQGLFYNDEIDLNIIPPRMYDQFIFPYEKELAEFHGGVAYWHSCGKITPVLPWIRKLPGLRMVKISSWNNYREAARICPDVPLEICVNAIDYIQMAEPEQMAGRVREILDICREEGVKAFLIRSEPLQKLSENAETDLAKYKQWIETARKVAQG
jgi:uroporphyrinogen-III decarboxylase